MQFVTQADRSPLLLEAFLSRLGSPTSRNRLLFAIQESVDSNFGPTRHA